MILSEADMVMTLFKFVISMFVDRLLPKWLPLWSIGVLFIILWWLLLWGIRVLLINNRVRPSIVVIQTQWVLSLIGSIFIFNLFFVPVVLIAFRGMALFTLFSCTVAAILYFIRVDDRSDTEDKYGF